MYEILQKLKTFVISEYFARSDTFLWHVLIRDYSSFYILFIFLYKQYTLCMFLP